MSTRRGTPLLLPLCFCFPLQSAVTVGYLVCVCVDGYVFYCEACTYVHDQFN